MAKVRANRQGQASNTVGIITSITVITTAPAGTTVYAVGADGIITTDVPAAVANVICDMDHKFKIVSG